MALTPKQERFCQCIVSGMSGKDSYLTAYDTSANDNTVYNEAKKLLQRDDITARIVELRKPIENHAQNMAISARNEQIEYIKGRIAICEQKDDEQSLIRWNDMLNKIHALYKDNEPDQTKEHSVVNLDMDTLKKLSGAS